MHYLELEIAVFVAELVGLVVVVAVMNVIVDVEKVVAVGMQYLVGESHCTLLEGMQEVG